MFDIGFGEMILLMAIILVAVGPKQLPEVARTLGRLLNEFKRATGDFSRTIIEARDSVAQDLTVKVDIPNPLEQKSPAASHEPQAPSQAAPTQTAAPVITVAPPPVADDAPVAVASTGPEIQPAPGAQPIGKKEI